MNWNLIVFIIFWIGIIYYIHQDAEFISSYSKNQIICTIVTHFIAPLSLIIIYWFVMGNEKIEYFNMWKKFDIYIAMLYPLLYMFYIYIRGLMYEKDSLSFGAWPYPFLDFENLFIGNSIFSYMILLSVIFFFWITAHHLFLMYINNLAFKFKIKNINKEL
ncbi:hypothetical protein [Spiroplasma taiwanense]|nr:hypothetical protein [Spiroplasma taiwanense]